MSICINPSCLNPQNLNTELFCQSCGSELLLEGRYRVTRQLGTGGFGRTYEVSDYDGSIKVLKVLIQNDFKYIELFQREAQVLAQLNHPGIPRVEPDAYFTFFPHNGKEPLHCLVMEKIEGLDLQQYIQKRGRVIKQKRAIQWLVQVATILKEVHKQNFFHRDIKPSNIMLRANGQLVLIDFGTVREMTPTFMAKQSAGEVTGVISAGYTPLEQINGQALPQSDFFALGRTFVFLLTGKHPSQFHDPYTNQLHWREAVPNISPQFADFLDRLMAHLPNQRPQTAQIILQQLAEINRALYPQASSQSIVPTNLPETGDTEAVQYVPPSTSPRGSIAVPTGSASSTPVPTESHLEQGFISRCQQELAELIGPMAAIVCKRTLSKNTGISRTEFVEALAKKIPNQKQALEFQQRLLK
ncbi:MAG: serine/threonine protein kinase [Xenococcaceae cyanobacterium]